MNYLHDSHSVIHKLPAFMNYELPSLITLRYSNTVRCHYGPDIWPIEVMEELPLTSLNLEKAFV